MNFGRDGPYRPGFWWIRSKKDPRWNADGQSLFVSEGEMPQECKEKLEEFKKIYGEPPDDFEWGYLRD
ncbi:hypothetical protein KJ885_02585 [Patescibacteria group bacterium]|nr:hypothetical protein [Patescibacteria group bacterium]